MTNIQPTVVVGLGDVGRRTVAYFKRRFTELYGPLPSVLLWTITMEGETTKGGSAAADPLPTELLPAEDFVLDVAGEHKGAEIIREKYAWLPENVVTSERVDTTARAAARLGFLRDAPHIVSWLRESLNRLTMAEARRTMREKGLPLNEGAAIYLVAALDDPVGSGLFLDMAYLVREMLRIDTGVNTTGVLFLPDPDELNQLRGANAYAALKELEYHMAGGRYHHRFSNQVIVESEAPPFTHGCFIMDTINEKHVSLGERDEASAMVGEWIFQAALSPCKSPIDGFINSGHTTIVAGREAAYGSLGFAGYVLPVEELIDWSARRLGAELLQEYVLQPVGYDSVSAPVDDFVSGASLQPKRLIDNVLSESTSDLINTSVTPLESVPYGQLQDRIQGQLNAIRERLRRYARQSGERKDDHRRLTREALRDEVTSLLNRRPAGGISQGEQFLDGLADTLQGHVSVLERYEEALEKRIATQKELMTQQQEALRRVLKSLPRMPGDYALLVLGFLAAFLFPLLIVLQLYLDSVLPYNGLLGLALMAGTILLAIGVVMYAVWDLLTEVESVRNQYLALLRDRLHLELELIHTRQALDFYPDINEEALSQGADLKAFTGGLEELQKRFRKESASVERLTGTVDFPLQRSLLQEEIIERKYLQATGDLEARLTPLLTKAGSVAEWRQLNLPELEERFVAYGREVFAPLAELSVEQVLRHELTTEATEEQVEQIIQVHAAELMEQAAPMWSYNRYAVGQDLGAMSKLTLHRLLSMNNPDRSKLDEEFQKQGPEIMAVATDDPHRLHLSIVRQGLPLFGLNHFESYQSYYREALCHSERALHVARDYLLSPDLMPGDVKSGLPLAALFAVGRAMGAIEVDGDGRFTLSLDEAASLSLAHRPDRSVAVLSVEPDAAAELDRQIDKWVAESGSGKVIAMLEERLQDRKEWEDWEREAIEQFIERLRA